MSASENREAAQKEILKCTHNGKLDLKELKASLTQLAYDHAVQFNFKNKISGGTLEDNDRAITGYQKDFENSYNLAAREVLGVIPESKWDDTYNVFSANPRTLNDFKQEHGLIIKKSAAQNDPNKSLFDQGYEFEISPERKTQTQFFKVQARLNNYAAAMNGTVGSAQNINSVQREAVHTEELQTIEKVMQAFIKECQKNPLLLTAQAQSEAHSALLRLKESSVVKNPIIADEVKTIEQLISPATKAALELSLEIKNATDLKSKSGASIHSDELEKIEKKMKAFIDKYDDAPLLSDQSKTALTSAMKTLQQAKDTYDVKDEADKVSKILAGHSKNKDVEKASILR